MSPSTGRALEAGGRWLDPALALAGGIARRVVWVGGGLLLLSAIVVAIDVILRKLAHMSVGGADELSGYAFAIAVAWAFPFALLQRANVRIDAIYQHLPARLAGLLDAAALISMAVLVSVLTRYAWDVVAGSWRLNALSNSQLGVPLWIPQGLWFAGLFLFLITTILLSLRTVLALISGDLARVRALAGARGIEEEAADEAAYGKTVARAEGAMQR